MEDTEKELYVIKASLLAKGYAVEVEEGGEAGVRITKKGYAVAYKKWMALDGEDRILLALLFNWAHTHPGEDLE